MFITIPALLIGVLLSLALSHKLKKAINDLSVAAQSISKGEFASRCEESGTGELLELQKNFNSMAESFEESEQRLQMKVGIATSSLSNIIDDLNLKHQELVKSRQETITLERSQAISAERERIMRDMHDGIGGQLVASLALLEKETDSELKNNISQIISDCLNDLRLIINSLNTADNSLGKLLADLKFRMNKRLERLDIKLIWHIADIAEDLILPPQKSLNLLRILQEVFTNILKHANATEIQFSLVHEDNNIIIEINDNGYFDTNNINKNGIGITNMKNRTSALNAEFSMTQNEQGGCMIRLILEIDKLSLPVLPSQHQA
jgi:signal transduction histidine kinase